MSNDAIRAGVRLLCSFALWSLLPSQTTAAVSDRLSIGTRHSIASEVLSGQREILISLPDRYETDREARYPVLYVLGASSHFLHSVAAARYLATSAKAMPDVIVVGVIHVDGGDELRPGFPVDGQSNAREASFRQYLTAELVPHIDSTYRTRSYRILMGHSLGGLFVLNTLRRSPDSFDTYFAFSPALWWDNGGQATLIREAYLSTSFRGQSLVMTMANELEDSRLPYLEMVEAFGNQPTRNLAVHARELPNETHISSAPVAMYWALQVVFSGWSPDAMVMRSGLPGLKEHYGTLSERFGWEIPIPLDTAMSLVFDFSRRAKPGDYDKAGELIEYALAQSPATADDFVGMIEALNLQNHPEAANLVRQSLCNIRPDSPPCALHQPDR